MDITHQIIVYLFVYFVVIFLFAYFSSRKQTQEEFLISGRNRGWLSIAMSKYATSIGASWFISYTAFIYQFGVGVFGMVIGYVISMLILAYYISSKLHAISQKRKFLRIGDIVVFKTGAQNMGNMTNILGSAINFMWLLVTVSGGANLIAYFNILQYDFALLLMILVVLAYLLFMGYRGVITTDIIQSIILLSILLIISVSMFGAHTFSGLRDLSFEPVSLGTVLGFFVYGVFSTFSFIDRYQLLFSGKKQEELKKGFLSVIPLVLFSVVLLLIMGYLVRNYSPNIDPSVVFVRAIELYLPLALTPFAVVMFFAAVMSSFDSYIYGISSHLNVFSIKEKITNIRVNSILLSLLAGIVCYFERSIVDITVFAAGFSLILSVPMIYLFWGKDFLFETKKSSRFLFSCIGSLVGLLLGIAIIGLEPSIAVFPLLFGALGLTINSSKLNTTLSKV